MAVKLHSECQHCHKGTMSIDIPMDMDERIDARCGRLLWVECTECRAEEYAFREPPKTYPVGKQPPAVSPSNPQIGHLQFEDRQRAQAWLEKVKGTK